MIKINKPMNGNSFILDMTIEDVMNYLFLNHNDEVVMITKCNTFNESNYTLVNTDKHCIETCNTIYIITDLEKHCDVFSDCSKDGHGIKQYLVSNDFYPCNARINCYVISKED